MQYPESKGTRWTSTLGLNRLGRNTEINPKLLEDPEQQGIIKRKVDLIRDKKGSYCADGRQAVTIGEQSAATPGTRAADPRILQHFQAALVNLISEASKIGLSLPIGLGVSSPYELTTPGIHPPGRLRSEVHIVIPDTQARQSTEETPQDHTEDFEGRKQRKGKGVMNEESREERDQVRTHGVNSSDTYQRNRRRHRSISSEDKSPRPRRELRSKRAKRSEGDQRALKIEEARMREAIMVE
ncbi:hypothetical protein LWI29_006825 [Acer saccharum]|uniref:Uncharacterized protein n=1 Tax=Acer saccharum TaxID=4024 RepID=A0AA39RP99_ACESA|nr:hypothetical protein LWI29_006825 [Acer saccharum]